MSLNAMRVPVAAHEPGYGPGPHRFLEAPPIYPDEGGRGVRTGSEPWHNSGCSLDLVRANAGFFGLTEKQAAEIIGDDRSQLASVALDGLPELPDEQFCEVSRIIEQLGGRSKLERDSDLLESLSVERLEALRTISPDSKRSLPPSCEPNPKPLIRLSRLERAQTRRSAGDLGLPRAGSGGGPSAVVAKPTTKALKPGPTKDNLLKRIVLLPNKSNNTCTG